jgi:hypothetical protein
MQHRSLPVKDHRYQSCRDRGCERPYCVIWREAWAEGYAEGEQAGFAAGLAAARAQSS